MKLSILVTTYNQQDYISECIRSLITCLNHVSHDFEILIGNDKSTDNTEAMIKKLCIELRNENIKTYNYEKNIGGLKNIEYLLKKSKGDYVLIIEGDDFYNSSDYFNEAIEFLDNNDQSFISSGSFLLKEGQLINNPLNIFKNFKLEFKHLALGNFIQMGTVIFKRSSLLELPEYFFNLHLGDWPLLLILLNQGQGYYLNKKPFVYRIHGGGAWALKHRSKQICSTIYTTETIIRSCRFRKKNVTYLMRYLSYLYTRFYIRYFLSWWTERSYDLHDFQNLSISNCFKSKITFLYYLIFYVFDKISFSFFKKY